MPSANEEGKPSIDINEHDVQRAVNLGEIELKTRRSKPERKAQHLSPSTLYSESLIRFNELQETKKLIREEIEEEILALRERCQKYGVNFEEVVKQV